MLENELREERDRNQVLGRELDKCRAEKEDAMTRYIYLCMFFHLTVGSIKF